MGQPSRQRAGSHPYCAEKHKALQRQERTGRACQIAGAIEEARQGVRSSAGQERRTKTKKNPGPGPGTTAEAGGVVGFSFLSVLSFFSFVLLVCLSVCLSVCLHVCLSVSMCVYPSSVPFFFFHSFVQAFCLSFCLSHIPSVSFSDWLIPGSLYPPLLHVMSLCRSIFLSSFPLFSLSLTLHLFRVNQSFCLSVFPSHPSVLPTVIPVASSDAIAADVSFVRHQDTHSARVSFPQVCQKGMMMS